jgi:regulatory protein
MKDTNVKQKTENENSDSSLTETKEPLDAVKTAMGLLSYKEWTESALAERLLTRGCAEADISHAMAWLIDQGLINDQHYAIEFASGRMRTRRWGIIKISAALKKRGISSKHIEHATALLKGESENNTARAALEKWLRIKRVEPPLSRETRVKAMNHLRSKGFTGSAIGFAMSNDPAEAEELDFEDYD